jgi:aspartate aminotransferase
MLSKLAQSLTPSPTLSLDARVKKMQTEGTSVINLCLGEPDFNTPQYIQQASTIAIHEGFTHYTQAAGLPELRTVISEKFIRENHIAYDPAEIIVGLGSKSLLYLVFRILINKGDEVLVPVPTWNTFVEQVKLCGGNPVLIPLKPPFKLTALDIKKNITKKTKILLLNNPSNPTGAKIEKNEIKRIAKLAIEHNIYILADEIYEKLIYKGKHTSIASLDKNIKERTITINGFSKAYAMTGWRIGYAGGPKDVIYAMASLQSQIASSAVTFVQKAGFAALTGNQESLHMMLTEFTKRRKFIISELKKIKGISFTEPEGAFYIFVSVKKLLGKPHKTSAEWCEALLEKQHVAVVPGEAFFYPGYFRLSFAASIEELRKAIQRIKQFCQNR